jgi:hypothetical protein
MLFPSGPPHHSSAVGHVAMVAQKKSPHPIHSPKVTYCTVKRTKFSEDDQDPHEETIKKCDNDEDFIPLMQLPSVRM